MVAALLVGYSMRAVRRNNDWQSETHLFVAALDACPDSAKVRPSNDCAKPIKGVTGVKRTV
jgi:hypothetical protein